MNPVGELASLTFGNSISRTVTPNARWQPQEITDKNSSGTVLLDLTYTWDSTALRNNGSLQQQAITTPGAAFTQNYTYDALRRLQSISDTAGASSRLTRTFAYDAFGNSWVPNPTSGLPYSQLTPTTGSQFNLNNQLGTAGGVFAYDPSGNLTTLGSYSLGYDYENRLTGVQQGQGLSLNYIYDGFGNRVQKTTGSGATTIYVHDAFGQLAQEYSTVAPTPLCATCYFSWDHLGSTRMVTDAAGNVTGRHDFLVFGDEVGGGTMGRSTLWNAVADGTTQRFTGQERDESTLDYFGARYYSAALGRFASPDPLSVGADLGNPQSWNGYAYVMNSPLSAVDPDGMQSCQGNCVYNNNTGTGSGSSGGSDSSSSSSGFSIGFFGFTLGGGPSGIAGNFARGSGRVRNARPGTAWDPNSVTLQDLTDVLAAIQDSQIGEPSLTQIDQLMGTHTVHQDSNAYKWMSFAMMIPGMFDGAGEEQVGIKLLRRGAAEMASGEVGELSSFYRRGGYDTRKLLIEQAQAAAERLGIHGVSVSSVPKAKPGQMVRASTRQGLEAACFKIEKTGADPSHCTVHLPSPVTTEITGLWNELFQIFK